jgi:hypothetical protein
MFFVAKILLTQPLKSQKFELPNLKYQLKNKYPPLAKNFTKRYHSVVTHVLYHFCDMILITACEIFCSLKFHVVCTCTFFGDTICLTTNRKMIKIVTLNLWLIHILYWHMTVDIAFQSPIFEWVMLWKWQYIFITQPLSCFVFHLPNLLLTQNFVYPTLFSSVLPPAINNDRSLINKYM